MSEKAPWITFRPELRVLDCTIRDGGLINDHQFDNKLVRAVYDTCVAAGVDYMEIGYKNARRLFPKTKYGPFRCSSEEEIRAVVGEHSHAATGLKLGCMIDAGKSDWKTDVLPKKDSVLDFIRVACYISQIPEAVDMVHDAHEKGYETSVNIMAISVVQEAELDQALEVIAQTPTDMICVVDSYGALYREQIDRLVRKYTAAVEGKAKKIGIHAHNNLQLAFANTIEAIILGANVADATMAGLGRGAGNCPMELLLGFLRNPKFKQRPVLELLQKHFLPLQKQMEWGPLVPYNLTGQLNCHPRAAMEVLASPQRDDFTAFYDRVAGAV